MVAHAETGKHERDFAALFLADFLIEREQRLQHGRAERHDGFGEIVGDVVKRGPNGCDIKLRGFGPVQVMEDGDEIGNQLRVNVTAVKETEDAG